MSYIYGHVCIECKKEDVECVGGQVIIHVCITIKSLVLAVSLSLSLCLTSFFCCWSILLLFVLFHTHQYKMPKCITIISTTVLVHLLNIKLFQHFKFLLVIVLVVLVVQLVVLVASQLRLVTQSHTPALSKYDYNSTRSTADSLTRLPL